MTIIASKPIVHAAAPISVVELSKEYVGSSDTKTEPLCVGLYDTEGQVALEHVLEVVLELEVHEPLPQALYQGGFDIHDILRMSSDDVKGLNYKDYLGNETDLQLGDQCQFASSSTTMPTALRRVFPLATTGNQLLPKNLVIIR
jgi:hypothetical protein